MPARRRAAFALLLAVLLAGALAVGRSPAVAQEATPGAGTEVLPGIFFLPLAGASLDQLPYAPAAVSVQRVTFTPGSQTPPGPDPHASLNYVESGSVVLRAEGPVTVFRAGTGDAPGPEEQTQPGTDVTVRAGDSFLLLPGVPFQVSNPGAEPAVLLLVFLLPPEGAGEATPAA
jgi:quercetin dioxygenase-like cupin family protein